MKMVVPRSGANFPDWWHTHQLSSGPIRDTFDLLGVPLYRKRSVQHPVRRRLGPFALFTTLDQCPT